MFRNKALILPGALLALSASCSSSEEDLGQTREPKTAEMAAVSLGVTIMSTDDSGAPRLVRTVTNRPARSGVSAEQAAREHLSSLKSLYMTKRAPSDLATVGTQKLRNGATMVRLQQQVDGIPIHQGELRVLVQNDGSLSAIAGTMLPTAARTQFKSSPKAAL